MKLPCTKTTQLESVSPEVSCQIKGKEYRIAFFPSVSELPEEWVYLASQGSTFVQKPYLTALELAPPTNMNFGYLLFYKDGKAIGLSCLQTTIFQAEDSLNDGSANPSIFAKLGNAIKNWFSKIVKIPVLIGGNILVTGENSYVYSEDDISEREFIDLWKEGLHFAKAELKKRGLNTHGFFLKDFFEPKVPFMSETLGEGFHELSAQPNMVFHVREEWETFEDYLGSMSSKYRTRAKSAYKKGKDLERRVMDEKLIEVFSERIHELYKIVATNAGFNLFILHDDYFLELKRQMGDQYEMVGYFADNQLVGFRTLINSHDDLDAHFVGYDPAFNRQCKLYQCMLYDMIKAAIERKAANLIFARTAMEIKSAAGAEGYNMSFFLKHQNGFINRYTGRIYNYLEPPVEWVARSPFK